jgi:hypothetical protein
VSVLSPIAASQAIYEELKSDATLLSLLGGTSDAPKIFPDRVIGDSVQLPAIIYSYSSSQESEARGGGENILSRPEFRIQALHEASPDNESYYTVGQIAARVNELLCGTGDGSIAGLSRTVDGYIVNGVTLQQPIQTRQTVDGRTTYYAGGIYRLHVSKVS